MYFGCIDWRLFDECLDEVKQCHETGLLEEGVCQPSGLDRDGRVLCHLSLTMVAYSHFDVLVTLTL